MEFILSIVEMNQWDKELFEASYAVRLPFPAGQRRGEI